MLLKIEHLTKSFQSERVLCDLTFSLNEHHTLSIVGRSGCGKTTLLKIIAGLIHPDAGEIYLQDKKINAVPAHERNIVYLYQEPLLFPHLNVFENIAFGLRLRKQPEAEIQKKTNEMIQSLQLQDHARKMPHQLSGGQKQRVSFGRALIINPVLLLLDEPFGNLDADTRATMQEFLRNVVSQFQITSIFVTHDLKEAIVMADQIASMQNGTLQIYEDVDAFVADAKTGVKREIEFWESLNERKNQK
jgi:ABC-type Fe3+/spermidine/putrescine transport system ATPase subunit